MRRALAFLAVLACCATVNADVLFRGQAPQYTWATKPTAASCAGCTVFLSDVGSNGGSNSSGVWTPTATGSFWFSTGSAWHPVGGSVVLCQGAPGSTNNTNSFVQMANCTIPAGMLGASGRLEVEHLWSKSGTTDGTTPRVMFSGGDYATALAAGCPGSCFYSNGSAASNPSNWLFTAISNEGATNAQVGASRTDPDHNGQNSIALSTTAVDTTAEAYVYLALQMAGTTDTGTLEFFQVKLLR